MQFQNTTVRRSQVLVYCFSFYVIAIRTYWYLKSASRFFVKQVRKSYLLFLIVHKLILFRLDLGCFVTIFLSGALYLNGRGCNVLWGVSCQERYILGASWLVTFKSIWCKLKSIRYKTLRYPAVWNYRYYRISTFRIA